MLNAPTPDSNVPAARQGTCAKKAPYSSAIVARRVDVGGIQPLGPDVLKHKTILTHPCGEERKTARDNTYTSLRRGKGNAKATCVKPMCLPKIARR